MSPFLAFLIISVAIILDYYWFDANKRRWGWMKNWSKLQKRIFIFVVIIAGGVVTYLIPDIQYIDF